MRVVFFGTPQVALPALGALLASTHSVAGVVTQPDRPRGRRGSPQPSAVKEAALAAGLPVLSPASAIEKTFVEDLRSLAPDACAVVAYGHLLPPAVLEVPPKGTLNVHFSLLPKYRGAAPVQRALMAGERESGCSVFLLEPTLDTGPLLAQEAIRVGPEDTTGSLFERLAPLGARMMVECLDDLERGTENPVPQDPSLATPAPKIRPEEEEIDWDRDAEAICNLIRALSPGPGAYSWLRGRRVKFLRATPAEGRGSPGLVLGPGENFVVAAGTGAVRPGEVQQEGKRPMSAAEAARGWRLTESDRFGRAVDG